MAVTSVRLQPDVEVHLEAAAESLQRSKSWLINQALREYFQRQSDEQQRWAETLEALDAAANGQVIAAEAVHDWLRTWGSADELAAPKTDA